MEDNSTQDGTNTESAAQPANTESSLKPAGTKGPNAAGIVFGLVALLMAAVVITSETMGWQVDWSRLGPGSIVGIGVVLVVLGAIGLVRHHDDA